MQTIEIDFEVFKYLTSRRASESTTYNDVLREICGFPPLKTLTHSVHIAQARDMWIVKGVKFPLGTEFRASYKGILYKATAQKGGLLFNSKCYDSPSSAAGTITGNQVNGWKFWEARLPGSLNWQLMDAFRKKAA